MEEFTLLDGEEQSRIVALYRIDARATAVIHKEAVREANKPKPKGRRRRH